MVASDPDWGLTKGWYEDGANWSTFNDFFSRRLSSPEVRPIADADVVAPADSWPKDLWTISDDNQTSFTLPTCKSRQPSYRTSVNS